MCRVCCPVPPSTLTMPPPTRGSTKSATRCRRCRRAPSSSPPSAPDAVNGRVRCLLRQGRCKDRRCGPTGECVDACGVSNAGAQLLQPTSCQKGRGGRRSRRRLRRTAVGSARPGCAAGCRDGGRGFIHPAQPLDLQARRRHGGAVCRGAGRSGRDGLPAAGHLGGVRRRGRGQGVGRGPDLHHLPGQPRCGRAGEQVHRPGRRHRAHPGPRERAHLRSGPWYELRGHRGPRQKAQGVNRRPAGASTAARSTSPSAWTRAASQSTPTSQSCRTCSSPAPRDRASRCASTP